MPHIAPHSPEPQVAPSPPPPLRRVGGKPSNGNQRNRLRLAQASANSPLRPFCVVSRGLLGFEALDYIPDDEHAAGVVAKCTSMRCARVLAATKERELRKRMDKVFVRLGWVLAVVTIALLINGLNP